MKTIKVTDEMYDFLMELSAEINNQDHRGTAMPYFFQVQQTKEMPTAEGMGETTVWVLDGEVSLRTDEDIKEAVFEYKEWDLDDNHSNKAFEMLDQFDIIEILEHNYVRFEVKREHNYSNAFLTSKACQAHIDSNRHNLSSPVNYLSYASRNPELEGVLKFLCELTGESLHK